MAMRKPSTMPLGERRYRAPTSGGLMSETRFLFREE
jgi:hypothetical protein